MSQRVIGYTGEGKARRPIYAPEGPAVARTVGYVASASSRGFVVVGSALVPDDVTTTGRRTS